MITVRVTVIDAGNRVRWSRRSEGDIAILWCCSIAVTGSLLLALGVFTLVYWIVRVPAMFGYGWLPTTAHN